MSERNIFVLYLLVLFNGSFVGPTTAQAGQTFPAHSEKSYNILLFPVYVPIRRPLYDTIETHLSLADHAVSYLIYQEDFPEYNISDISARTFGKETHVIDGEPKSMSAHSSWERSAMTDRNSASVPTTLLRHLSSRCEWLLNDDDLMERLGSMKLDLIIVELQGNDVCGLVLGRRLKVGVIGFSPTALTEPFAHYTGNPYFQSYLPTSTSASSVQDLVTSWNKRAWNLYSYVTNMRTWKRDYYDNLARIACDQLPQDCPSVAELYGHMDLVFVNSDVVTEYARPVLPNVVHVGGIITKVPQLFPKDLEATARLHRIGIILVTLETSLGIDDYDEPFLTTIVNTLSEFKHVIFWKSKNGTVTNPPTNIVFQEEFSTQDIMGHARTRLVITLCDTDTVHSAIFHGVPVLCIPLLEHHQTLARVVQSRGLGETVEMDNFNVKSLASAIQKIITGNTYKENVRRSSRLLRDRPDTPSDRLIFWIEYVVRHRGIPHLRNRASFKMSFIQYFLLDVLVLPLIVALLAIIGMLLTVSWTFRKWSHRTTTTNQSVKRKSKRE